MGSVHGQAQSQGMQQTLGLIPEAALQVQRWRRPPYSIEGNSAEHPQIPPGPSRLCSLLRAPGSLPLHQTVSCEAKCCWVAQLHFRTPGLLPGSCMRLVERRMWRMSGQHQEGLCHEAQGSLPGGGTQDTFCRGHVGCLCVTKDKKLHFNVVY